MKPQISRLAVISFIVWLCTQSLSLNAQTTAQAFMVSNAHFDTQWNWDVQKSISEYIPRTLYSNLLLLERYPEYIFNFEGAVKYWWMKEYYPEAFAHVHRYVREGRWHLSGASWDATDPNIPSPESLTRNILYGQHFYKKEFGTVSTDIFLPDCFGFGMHLPTVARHCGLIGFSSQKLKWRENSFHGDAKEPFPFGKWYGIDGNGIYAVLRTGNYTRKFNGEDISQSKELSDLAAQSPHNIAMRYYGTGDRGGSPTLASVRSVVSGIHGTGPVRIVSATSDALFRYIDEKQIQVDEYRGELLMDVHGTGCYTSQAAMKLFNRRNEQAADAAERSAVAADWLGEVEYPREFLSTAWKRFIWHQFHDDLTGTSIPRAYEFSWNDEIISLRQFSDVETTSVGAVSKHLDTNVSGTPLVIYNPLGFDRTDIVTIRGTDGRIYDADGKCVPSQRTADGRTCFTARVPALGYAVYSIRKGTSQSKGRIKVSGKTIENSIYRVTLDGNGDIASIVDKRYGRELVAEGRAIRLAFFTNNESFRWPAWEIRKSTIDADPVAIEDSDIRITVEESGPIVGSIRTERKFNGSTFVQHIRLFEGANSDRIDITSDIDWNSCNALLKAEFPLSVSNEVNRYDIGIGSVERGVNTSTAYEVYAQQWADLTDKDGSYGVSVMNDCKYGWDKPAENMLRLTLLHTPKTDKRYVYQNSQDHGHHHFTYSIVGHEGDFRSASTVRKAEMLNQPLAAFAVPRHDGKLGRRFSFARPSQNVELRALKMAEDSDAYVVRFYETSGLDAQKASIAFAAPIEFARELDGNESVVGPADTEGRELKFEIGAFGMKTFLVKLEGMGHKTMEAFQIELPLNVNAVTFNAFRHDGDFDESRNSYAAEILPETIVYKGIEFRMGDPAAATALRCEGDTISLPQGRWNRIYLLASSSKEDVDAEFMVGNSHQTRRVPYYSGFIGQWGHTGHTEGYMKDADIAFAGTHKHSKAGNRDIPYEFTYLFCIGLDVPSDAKTMVLPKDERIRIFSAVAVDDTVNVARPFSDLPRVEL